MLSHHPHYAPLYANTTAANMCIHTEQAGEAGGERGREGERRGGREKKDVIVKKNHLTFLTCVISKTETAASSL